MLSSNVLSTIFFPNPFHCIKLSIGIPLNVVCVLFVFFFQTISISMLLRYCHHQIFVFIGKIIIKVMPIMAICVSLLVTLLSQLRLCFSECYSFSSTVLYLHFDWTHNTAISQQSCHRVISLCYILLDLVALWEIITIISILFLLPSFNIGRSL